MKSFSVTTFVLLGLICVINANLITNLLGKSDDKAETDDKTAATTTTTVKPAEGVAAGAAAGAAAPAVAGAAAPAAAGAATTTTTADPGSACGGLKGFLHICDKSEPTEPPKNVKTRSVDDGDDDDDSSSSEENSHELKEMRKKKETDEKDDDNDENADQEEQSSTSEATSTTESPKIRKRQTVQEEKKKVEEEVELDQPLTERIPKRSTVKMDEYPFESPVFAMLRKRSIEESKDEESKPMNTTEGTADQEEKGEEVRRRRDCGDGGKDCRRKRELVPCVEPKCVKKVQETENE